MTIGLFVAVQDTLPCAKMPTIGYSKKGADAESISTGPELMQIYHLSHPNTSSFGWLMSNLPIQPNVVEVHLT